jgi:hypothetical protein
VSGSEGQPRRGRPVHDVTLVEQAIAGRQRRSDAVLERFRAAEGRLGLRAEAEARRAGASARVADLVAQGRRALLFGAAAAIVILAIGIAVRLTQRLPVETAGAASWPAPPAESVAPPPGRPEIIVRDYVIFSEASVTVAGAEYSVNAGHRFETEQAASFESAWCHTQRYVDGIQVLLDLGTLEPGKTPVPEAPAVWEGSRRALGLSEADVATLFGRCPWLRVGP